MQQVHNGRVFIGSEQLYTVYLKNGQSVRVVSVTRTGAIRNGLRALCQPKEQFDRIEEVTKPA